MWFGQTGLNVNRFETGLSASVNGLLVQQTADWLTGLSLQIVTVTNLSKTGERCKAQ